MSLIINLFWTVLHYAVSIICILFLITYIYFKYKHYYWQYRGIECLKPYFIFGNLIRCFEGKLHINDIFKELHEQIKGPMAGAYFLHKPVLFIKDPEILKHILVKDFNNFVDRGVLTGGNEDPLSFHLFRLCGTKWKNLRHKLSPVFTSGKLKNMCPIIIKAGEQLQNGLEEFANKDQIFHCRDVCSRYTVDVISAVVFGKETDSFADPANKMNAFIHKNVGRGSYKNTLKKYLSFCVPEIVVLFKQHIHSDHIKNFMFDLVENSINNSSENNVMKNNLLQQMIQVKNVGSINEEDDGYNKEINDKKNDDNALTFNELASQAYVFIIAGFETSATAMSSCLFELAKNPEIQRKVQKNIDETLIKHNGKITYDSIFEMDYLSATVSETLRKYPPLGFLNRFATNDYKVPNTNYMIEKGTNIIVSIHGIQNDPNIFPEPEVFNPERFIGENKNNIKQFTYLPFGDGPRHCIGTRLGKIQTMIGLAMILSKYNIGTCPETPEKLSLLVGQVISVSEEVKLTITKRQ